jgi:hypothetical protein
MSSDFHFDFEQPTKKLQKEINFENYIVSANEDFPDSTPLLLKGDVPLFSSGEISLVTGSPKSKKTFLVSFLITALLSQNEYAGFTSKLQGNILLIDTEQGRRRTNSVVRRIYRLLNLDFAAQIPNFTAISIRELSANERLEVLEKAIKTESFSIVFLDGFADLVQNTNDLEECSRKVSQLMKLSEDHNTHICSVVHTNPNSDKTRGHIGSELQRKCETVALVKKDSDTTSTVSPQYCRNKEFESFSFFVNTLGLPETCDLPPLGIQAVQLFTPIFEDSTEFSYSDLCDAVMKKETISKSTAERRIGDAVRMDVIKKNEEGRYIMTNT